MLELDVKEDDIDASGLQQLISDWEEQAGKISVPMELIYVDEEDGTSIYDIVGGWKIT